MQNERTQVVMIMACAAVGLGCEGGSSISKSAGTESYGKADSLQCAGASLDAEGRCRNADGTFSPSMCCESQCGAQMGGEFALRVDVSVHDETVFEDDMLAEGWQWGDAAGSWSWQGELVLDRLPFRAPFGASGLSLGVSAEGLLHLSYRFGDYDAEAAGRTQLPIALSQSGTLVAGEGHVEVAGGDYASGVWSVDGRVDVARMR